ncbi:MAG: glycosyltransferase family 1 protein [Bdellovibrionales bacterium]|nr:glycosyltransferase family 1 protein [Bdellovibrionales bacterium]
MKILCCNQDWFVKEFREAGHEVFTVGLSAKAEVQAEAPLVHIDTIGRKVFPDGGPDAIVVYDNSAPIAFDGFAETSCPVLFFSVDAHHHYKLHAQISRVMDYVLVAQKDYIPFLSSEDSAPIEWMPLWASRMVEPSEDKQYGALFIGTLNRELNKARVEFFEQLAKRTEISFDSGRWWEKFPVSEIVINQSVRGDVNFRVFEAMVSGALLLTERTGNGLLEIFEEGKHLALYQRNDVADAASQIETLLAHPDRMHAIARAGREEILRAHLPIHRAKRILEILTSLKKRKSRRTPFLSWMSNVLSLMVRLRQMEPVLAKRALVHTLRSAEIAIERKERIDSESATELALACCELSRSDLGVSPLGILERVLVTQPELHIIRLVLVRSYLNNGMPEKARLVAEPLAESLGEEEVYRSAEELVGKLLATIDHYDPRLTK